VEFDLEFFASAARQNLGTDRNRTRVGTSQTRQKASRLSRPATVTIYYIIPKIFIHTHTPMQVERLGLWALDHRLGTRMKGPALQQPPACSRLQPPAGWPARSCNPDAMRALRPAFPEQRPLMPAAAATAAAAVSPLRRHPARPEPRPGPAALMLMPAAASTAMTAAGRGSGDVARGPPARAPGPSAGGDSESSLGQVTPARGRRKITSLQRIKHGRGAVRSHGEWAIAEK
jgi:hypothetical protein